MSHLPSNETPLWRLVSYVRRIQGCIGHHMTCVLGGLGVSIEKEEAREPLYKKLTDKNEETCRYQLTEKETFS